MDKILETFCLSKQYGKKQALEDVSLGLTKGKLIGLLGPNGSGKTTLIKLSAGLLTPTSGRVLVDGLCPGPAAKQRIAYLPDRLALPDEFRADDAVAFYKDFFADFDAGKASAMLADLKLDTKQRIGAMSKGTQEKVQLCLTMSRGAKLYLLDEPLGGVDPAAREYILQTILRNYSEDSTVLLSTHLVGDIEKALDEVVFLRQGRLMGHQAVDALREEHGMSVDAYFREVFRR
ncbi:ABC transporter ATP-binding protein [uncultured Gemmiger sp.]|uniref:ABC transporter ATP-binding protein n=1 Tax=uncultured Gemmiger sp. TaxID=1623490 RepID=UPI0025EEDBAF|nr:ABC transporter ATP-binding protein [uncultured Gemmiger sp.]